jgi:secondary thiamine-phosphate synthase enzyme
MSVEATMQRLKITSNQKYEFINITQQVQSALQESNMKDGVLFVYIPHTTAGVTINESADPTVVQDISKDLQRLVPVKQDYYQHFEGNSAAHMMASIVGSSVMVIVEDNQLVLGRWQGIFFCEFDGPRSRSAYVQSMQA